ncbi:MAG: J domain-containing protein [Betaproteobacteria bacterium]
MSTIEILISVGGVFFGYWIVSKLIVDKPKPRSTPDATSESPTGEIPPPVVHEPAWNEILNVSPDASTAEIKRAYRMLVSQYHPDKVATLGDELKAVAERKSAEINVAYAEAMRIRGDSP